MRSPLSKRLMPVLALVLVSAACSGSGSGDGGRDTAAKGLSAAKVCGGFANRGPALSALTALVGGDGLSDDRSESDATLKAL